MRRFFPATMFATWVVLCCSPASSTAAAPPLLRTQVDPHERGTSIPSHFLGISTDWGSVSLTTGFPQTGPNPIYAKLLGDVARTGAGLPTLRIGGEFQDLSWWNPLGLPKPPGLGLTIDITPPLMDGIAQTERLTQQPLIFGLNLAANSVSLVQDEARAILARFSTANIMSFDLGNEPDYYTSIPIDQKQVGGRLVTRYIRGKGWNGGEYLRTFDRLANAIHQLGSRLPVSGMDGYGAIVTPQRFMAREHSKVAMYTAHTYPLSACDLHGVRYKPGDPKYPTAAKLLGTTGTYATLAQVLRAVSVARHYGKPMRITEMNSISCAGKPGVSDSMTAGLWSLDQYLLDAAVGARGINIHIDGDTKTPFILRYVNGRWEGLIGPLWYAMLMFAQGTGDGRMLYSPLFHAHIQHGANVRVWPVRNRDGGYRFIAINKDLRRSGQFQINIPHATATASLIRFLAPSPRARVGITYGGQSYAFPTYDGKLIGPRVTETVRPRHGTYSFYVSKTSAALLTVPGPRG